jgi:acetyl-CoA decarbonylase/synthase, CODH/ACS complex subunit gamma
MMPLTGIQIYKLLPQTNCKECGFPTCLAFAMKLAAKQADLAACPSVSEASKMQLAESAAPPMRLVTLKGSGCETRLGNEVVLFRHDKTFYNPTGIFLRIKDDQPAGAIQAQVGKMEAYKVSYVGVDLMPDGYALESVSDSPEGFASAVLAVRQVSKRPLILISKDPKVLEAGLKQLSGECPLLYAADARNWEATAGLARQYRAALAVEAETLDDLAGLTQKIKTCGVEDMLLAPAGASMGGWLARSTQIRRLALKKNFRPLGYPTIAFAGAQGDVSREAIRATQAITKYASVVVLDSFAPELLYPLLVLRMNIFTDPQKPIQMQPGLYEINEPGPDDPVLVTTNFSITYFSVVNEVEGSGNRAWLLVADSEGMSVLTAWAAGKFDADRIAKIVRESGVAERISRKRIVLPGFVAVLSGEVEEKLPGWEVRVGPREAVDIPTYMKQALGN